MALIVTPGAPDADGLATFEVVRAYALSRGLPFAEHQADGEVSIRRGTTWLCNASPWKGRKTNGRGQALAFPRVGATDGEGEPIDPTTIPAEIVQACCEASIYEHANPGGLSPAIVLADRVRSERIGNMQTEYAPVAASIEAARPVLTVVDDLVAGLRAASANPLSGGAVRR